MKTQMVKLWVAAVCAAAMTMGWAATPRLSIFHCHVETMASQRKVSVAEAAQAVRSWGVEGVDVLNAPVGTPSVEAMFAAGLKPVSYIVFTDFGASDSTQMVERAFANVRKYGFERIMLVPGFTPKGMEHAAAWQAALPRLKAFLERAKAAGVTVEVEDFDAPNILLGSPEHLRGAFRLFPDLGHVLDTGNYAYWKWDVRQGLREFRSRVRHVHIKDRDREKPKRSVAHGTGSVPIREVVEELLASGYAGWFTLECFGSKQMWNDMETSAKFLKGIRPVDVAVYYFGNYHVDPRNEAHHGKGWTEWEYVKGAKPRFEGHRQPKVPLWGYLDEANPKDMAKKIDAAADHGVDAFLFDWYWYNGPFLNRTIDEGLKGAPNRNRIKFALMWANHEWLSLKPALPRKPRPLLYPGGVTPAEFDQVCDHVIERYFKEPNYWKIEGCPYFSIYDLNMLGSKLGGFAGTKAALERFRAKVKAAGFPDLHLAIVYWGRMKLAGGPKDRAELVKALGFDSATSYVWVHDVRLPKRETDYNFACDQYLAVWERFTKTLALPYYPNLSMGWDPSPRTDQTCAWTPSGGYPFGNVLVNNTPANFRKAAERIKARLDADPKLPRIVTVNSWNEWTEGSYIEPDQESGLEYLKAIRDVFGPTGGNVL